MPSKKFTDQQWETALALKLQGLRPPEISRMTGIPAASLYTRHHGHPEWTRFGINRIRADRLARMKRDYLRGMPKREWGLKHHCHPSRMYQLAKQHGWERSNEVRPGPKPVLRRCCGATFPYRDKCPGCGNLVT